jgi:hypothetical protein
MNHDAKSVVCCIEHGRFKVRKQGSDVLRVTCANEHMHRLVAVGHNRDEAARNEQPHQSHPLADSSAANALSMVLLQAFGFEHT